MSADLELGLILSAVGLSVTFLSLGCLILVIRVLLSVFAAGSKDEKAPTNEESRREDMAAALAVSIALLDQDEGSVARDPSLGNLLEP